MPWGFFRGEEGIAGHLLAEYRSAAMYRDTGDNARLEQGIPLTLDDAISRSSGRLPARAQVRAGARVDLKKNAGPAICGPGERNRSCTSNTRPPGRLDYLPLHVLGQDFPQSLGSQFSCLTA